jgi:hypothetical protein
VTDDAMFEAQSTEYDLNIHRKFANVDYEHAESVVDYTENYTADGMPDQGDKLKTFNHAGLSVWTQLNNRPDFLNAFKAFAELKSLYLSSDPYYRYFAKNIFYLAYNDLDMLKSGVLAGLSSSDQSTLYKDPKFGMDTP